jgi:predicted NUDIX family phosphoesterase
MSPRPQVLVIPRSHLESVALFQGFMPDRAGLLEQILDPTELRFMDRDAAEGDPSFKQLIPYMVIRHGSQFLAYTRGKKGSETRLHALKSIGVGGHVEPCDGPAHDALQWGMMRELREELHLSSPTTSQFLGLINDDSNEVGAVHLGLAYLIDIFEEPKCADLALVDPTMEPLASLQANADQFETWSKLLMEGQAGLDSPELPLTRFEVVQP